MDGAQAQVVDLMFRKSRSTGDSSLYAATTPARRGAPVGGADDVDPVEGRFRVDPGLVRWLGQAVGDVDEVFGHVVLVDDLADRARWRPGR